MSAPINPAPGACSPPCGRAAQRVATLHVAGGKTARSRFQRRAGVARNAILATLALLLAGVAGYRLIWSAGIEDAPPSDAGSLMGFLCEKCGAFFQYTAAQTEAARSRGEFQAGGDGRTLCFRCPTCGANAAVRAEKCPQHGDPVKLVPGPRDHPKCSKCDFRGTG